VDISTLSPIANLASNSRSEVGMLCDDEGEGDERNSFKLRRVSLMMRLPEARSTD
jgi:hypothetical protein